MEAKAKWLINSAGGLALWSGKSKCTVFAACPILLKTARQSAA